MLPWNLYLSLTIATVARTVDVGRRTADSIRMPRLFAAKLEMPPRIRDPRLRERWARPSPLGSEMTLCLRAFLRIRCARATVLCERYILSHVCLFSNRLA